MNNRTKAFVRFPRIAFCLILISYFSQLNENCQSYASYQTKMSLTMKPEDFLNFTFLCMKLSVPFIDKIFISGSTLQISLNDYSATNQ